MAKKLDHHINVLSLVRRPAAEGCIIDRRALLKALPGAAFAATLPTVVEAAVSVAPVRSGRERAEHHFVELKKALEEINGPHNANLDWDLGVAMLIATGDPATYEKWGTR